MVAARAFAAGHRECFTPAWFRTVARSRLIDHYRRSGREAKLLSVVGGAGGVVDAGTAPDAGTGDALGALRRLPAAQRLALALRYLDDLPVADVAAHLGRSVRATESLLSRGRAALRVAYDEEGCDAG